MQSSLGHINVHHHGLIHFSFPNLFDSHRSVVTQPCMHSSLSEDVKLPQGMPITYLDAAMSRSRDTKPCPRIVFHWARNYGSQWRRRSSACRQRCSCGVHQTRVRERQRSCLAATSPGGSLHKSKFIIDFVIFGICVYVVSGVHADTTQCPSSYVCQCLSPVVKETYRP